MDPSKTSPPALSSHNDAENLNIPLIDFSTLSDPQTSTALLSAFRTAGFLYLTNPPIPPSTLSLVFAHSAAFFARPQSEKDSLAWTTPRSNRGYVAHGREKVSTLATKEEVEELRRGGGKGRLEGDGDGNGSGGGEDMKESMEIGRPLLPAELELLRLQSQAQSQSKEKPEDEVKQEEIISDNHWPSPSHDPRNLEFRTVMEQFFESCRLIHSALMSAIAIAMGLESGFFDPYVRRGDNTLRLLHYPGVARSAFSSSSSPSSSSTNGAGTGGAAGGKDVNVRCRAGEHTDYGSVTLLFQDQRGGLQVKGRRAKREKGNEAGNDKEDEEYWMDVHPIPGTIVVNAGDLLARWSNGSIRSTLHRVVEPPPCPLPPGEQQDQVQKHNPKESNNHEQNNNEFFHPARYSIAYFCNPDFDRWIEALPGTWEEEMGRGGKKFEGINSGEYLVGRLSATY